MTITPLSAIGTATIILGIPTLIGITQATHSGDLVALKTLSLLALTTLMLRPLLKWYTETQLFKQPKQTPVREILELYQPITKYGAISLAIPTNILFACAYLQDTAIMFAAVASAAAYITLILFAIRTHINIIQFQITHVAVHMFQTFMNYEATRYIDVVNGEFTFDPKNIEHMQKNSTYVQSDESLAAGMQKLVAYLNEPNKNTNHH